MVHSLANNSIILHTSVPQYITPESTRLLPSTSKIRSTTDIGDVKAAEYSTRPALLARSDDKHVLLPLDSLPRAYRAALHNQRHACEIFLPRNEQLPPASFYTHINPACLNQLEARTETSPRHPRRRTPQRRSPTHTCGRSRPPCLPSKRTKRHRQPIFHSWQTTPRCCR